MTRPLRIVAVSGGLQRPSRAAALAEHLLDLIGEDIHSEQQLIELGELAPQLAGALWRSQLPEAVERRRRAGTRSTAGSTESSEKGADTQPRTGAAGSSRPATAACHSAESRRRRSGPSTSTVQPSSPRQAASP